MRFPFFNSLRNRFFRMRPAIAGRRVSDGIEMLEARIAPATLYVGKPGAFTLQNDVAPAGLSDGDTVSWLSAGTVHGGAIGGLILGTTAFGTIQDAADAVQLTTEQDTIRVADGSYDEDVFLIDPGLRLLGAGASLSTIRGVIGGDSATVRMAASDEEVAGFTIAGAADETPLGAGMRTDANASGYQIRNNIFRDNIAGLALNSSGLSQTIVENNLFVDNDEAGAGGGTGIYSEANLVDALIRDNRFAGNHFSAAIRLVKQGSLSEVEIRENEFADGNRVELFGTVHSSIVENTFTGTALPGPAVVLGGGNSRIDISGNSFTDRAGGAVTTIDAGLGPDAEVSILNNVITQDAGLMPSAGSMIRLANVKTAAAINQNTITLRGTMPGSVGFVHGITIEGAGTETVGVIGNTLDGGGLDLFGGTENNTGVQLRGSLPAAAQIVIEGNTIKGWAVPSENRETHAVALGATNFGPGVTEIHASSFRLAGLSGYFSGGGVLKIQPFNTQPEFATIGVNGAPGALQIDRSTMTALNGMGGNRLAHVVFSGSEIAVNGASDFQTFVVPVTLQATSLVTLDSKDIRVSQGLTVHAPLTKLGSNIIAGGPIALNSPVTLTNNIALETTSALAPSDVTITGAVDGDGVVGRTLAIRAGAGKVIFGDNSGALDATIGGVRPLGSIDVSGAEIRFGTDVGGLTTSYSNSTLNGNISLTATAAPLKVTVPLKSGTPHFATGALTVQNQVQLLSTLTFGRGTIVLTGPAGDLVIEAPLAHSASINLRATNDVQIKAPVSVQGSGGSDLRVFADTDENGTGRVLVTAAGQLLSGRDVLVRGAGPTNPLEAPGGIHIEADAANQAQVKAGRELWLFLTPNAPVGEAIWLSGLLEAGLGVKIDSAVRLAGTETRINAGSITFNGPIGGEGSLVMSADPSVGVIAFNAAAGTAATPLGQITVESGMRFISQAEIFASGFMREKGPGDTDLLGPVKIVNGGNLTVSSTSVLIKSTVEVEGDILLATNKLTLLDDHLQNSIKGPGTLTIRPLTAGVSMGINESGQLDLTTSELAKLADGFRQIIFGSSSSTSPIRVGTAIFRDPVSFLAPLEGGSITVTGTIYETQQGGAVTMEAPKITIGPASGELRVQTDQGAIGLRGDLELKAKTYLVSNNGGGNADPGGNISLDGKIGGAFGFLAIAGTGTIDLNGPGGATQPPVFDVDVDGLTLSGATVNVRATVLTEHDQEYTGATHLFGSYLASARQLIGFHGPVVAHGDATISAGADITFGSTLDGTGALTLITPESVVFAGAVGGQNPLGGLKITDASFVRVDANLAAAGAIDLTADAIGFGTGHTSLTGDTISLSSRESLTLKAVKAAGQISLIAPEINLVGGAGSVDGGFDHPAAFRSVSEDPGGRRGGCGRG